MRRVVGLAAMGVLTAAAMTYMARTVPIRVHTVPPGLVPHLWFIAAAALLVMLVVDAVILTAVYRRGAIKRRQILADRLRGFPTALVPKRVGFGTAGATALASGTLLVFGTALLGLPLWASVLLALLPWLPLYVSEVAWQYRHYGVYALFGTLVVLQLGHLGEHVTQNVQLLVTHGKLAASRGVFGQLDVEAVHFYWNIVIWLGTGALLFKYGFRNFWLTISFVVASLHSVEHIYLYWLYVTDPGAYVLGGWNGILGAGGLIGSPLARPYLHFVYNMLEVTPFVLAYWDESRIVYDRAMARPTEGAVAAFAR